MDLEVEILEALKRRGTPMRSYAIREIIEDNWEQKGITKELGFGTLHRALDKLEDHGLIERHIGVGSHLFSIKYKE